MICSGGRFDLDSLKRELAPLVEASEDPNLWDNQQEAMRVLKAKTALSDRISRIESLQEEFSVCSQLVELAEAEQDQATLEGLVATAKTLLKQAKAAEIEAIFTGEADSNDCFLEINAGAGGTESHDWAEMLLRMYLRFAEQQGYKSEIIDSLAGEEAGIKSATVKILGQNAYGWCKSESGVHRLVRISPFNAQGKRQTSFASVWVYPVVDDNIDIVIEPQDIRVDTFRASGAGGQHVNTTESAIRITHIPTGIAVQCQNDRSQHRNRSEAMLMLKARLYEVELKKREQELTDAHQAKTDIGWGHQIRSYVLQPYQMIKDLRTGFETSNVQAVLDGDLTKFMEAYLVKMANHSKE